MLGDNIKKLRQQKGYTQETLAQEMNVVRQTVSKWEKGYSVPDAVMLEKLAGLLEVPVSDLLGNAEKSLESKTDIEQISSQLSILNDQFAKELARKKRNRKIVFGIILAIIPLFFISHIIYIFSPFLFGTQDFNPGDVSNVKTHEVASELFTQYEIDHAINAVKAHFSENWEGCILKEIYYAGDEQSNIERQYYKEQDNSIIVLTSSFYVPTTYEGGSYPINCKDWTWTLCRLNNNTWYIINNGYT